MKQIFGFVVVLFLVACSNQSEYLLDSGDIQNMGNCRYNIGKERAKSISDKTLGKHDGTRSDSGVWFEYVLRRNKTRSATLSSDTLAYIVNYPYNEGFVIVAADSRINSVLAYSAEGNFDMSNPIAKETFIDGLEGYIDAVLENPHYTSSQNIWDADSLVTMGYSVQPRLKITMHQTSPWNKSLQGSAVGCPVGCVAVATALIMSHTKNALSYHGTLYEFSKIVNAIEGKAVVQDSLGIANGGNSKIHTPNITYAGTDGKPGSGFETYMTYDGAVNAMADLLYWIGQDVNMQYSYSGSGANSYDAYTLFKNLNFNIPSGYENFSIAKIANYLRSDCLIYLRGSQHAWVCDGCRVIESYVSDPAGSKTTYLHCEWGWGGSCNGYYTGSVFDVGNGSFTPANYFAVKIETE